MDHHGDWDQWHEDGHELEGDTADLGGEHYDDLGHHDLSDAGHEDYGSYETYEDAPAPDFSHGGPDLVHEGADDDFGRHDVVEDYDTTHDAPPDHVVGIDPDVPPDPDTGWHDGDFPPPLDLDVRPEPADGYPWADPDTLGDPGHEPGYDATDYGVTDHSGAPPAGDLYAYAGMDAPPPGVDPWGHLLASDDPATGALARFWGPSGG